MRRPFILAAIAGIAATGLLAPAALAKMEGTVTLAAPLPRDAEPGSTITVTWTVTTTAGDEEVPIGGSPVFVRLIGVDDTSEVIGTELVPGTYRADVMIPRGGIVAAEFGLQGTASYEDGRTERVDVLFAVEGAVLSEAAPPPAANPGSRPADERAEPAPATPAPDVRLPIGLAFAILTLAALATRRRAAARTA